MSYTPASAQVTTQVPTQVPSTVPDIPGMPIMFAQPVGYVYNQVHGLTQPTIHNEGLLGVVDRVWLTFVRINTLFFLATVCLTVLSAVLVMFSGKKESFSAGASNMLEEARKSIGSAVTKLLYLK